MIGWIVAFLVHGTLWLGATWLWLRLRPGTHARTRETMWFTAIVASLLTPTLQSFVAPDSALWRVPFPTHQASNTALNQPERESGHAASEEGVGGEHARPVAVATSPGPPADSTDAGWRSAAPWVWLAFASVFVLSYCGRLEALRRRLGKREVISDTRVRRTLRELSRSAGLSRTPVLTESDDLGSPIALGFGRHVEICVPTRARHELDGDEFRALLGHEVAHHARRDSFRLGTLNTLQAVFFFQPLLRVAARAIHAAAEEQCDDWAASQVEDRLAMASCLTEVATWVLPRDRGLPVPCMARRRSLLGVRVDRLMDERLRSPAPNPAWRRISATALLALAAWLAPGVAPASAAPSPSGVRSGLAEGHDGEGEPAREDHNHDRRREGHEHSERSRGRLRRMLEAFEAIRRSIEAPHRSLHANEHHEAERR
ncbi:MAG: hypothetical protein CL908_08150 [Deltaproteobacteria bacterium]|nr:hypothetical protein [Deltaproteobacteria bacterium]